MDIQLVNYLIYFLTATISIYVLNRYFSGGKYIGTNPNLEGFVAVLTGGNSGIGKQTAIALAHQGCKVIIGARDTDKSQKLVSSENKKLGKNLLVQFSLDLGNLESIQAFVEKIKDEKVDFLINNAGVMSPPKRKTTKSGFQFQYGINHLGHFYLTYLLWGKLLKSKFFRIVNVSSLAHKKVYGFLYSPKPDFSDMNFEKNSYNPGLSYSRSKLYNNLFTHALAERIPSGKGIAFSLHPGVVRTDLTRQMLTGWQQKCFQFLQPVYSIFTKSSWQGAQTTITVLFQNPQKLVNGGYYSDCHISKENPNVKKQNWDKLWQVSQRDLNIKFSLN